MGTISNPMQPAAIRQLTLVRKDASPNPREFAQDITPVEDGLGVFRAFAAAMVCNMVFALIIAAGWGLWRLLR